MIKCQHCGRNPSQISGYLTRTNEKGVEGIWSCAPTCDADLPRETVVLMAIEGENVTAMTDEA